MSEAEGVRNGKFLNWKVSESENVRIGKCRSDTEGVRNGKFHQRKVSESKNVRTGKSSNQKMSEYCRKVSELQIVRIGK